jgi:hypothetical protein
VPFLSPFLVGQIKVEQHEHPTVDALGSL